MRRCSRPRGSARRIAQKTHTRKPRTKKKQENGFSTQTIYPFPTLKMKSQMQCAELSPEWDEAVFQTREEDESTRYGGSPITKKTKNKPNPKSYASYSALSSRRSGMRRCSRPRGSARRRSARRYTHLRSVSPSLSRPLFFSPPLSLSLSPPLPPSLFLALTHRSKHC